jgi:hypothetical protein
VTGANQSLPAATCNDFTGIADDDVWFSFEATTATVQISAAGSEGYDAVLEVFEGDCNGLTSLGCVDGTLDGGEEAAQVTELTVGNTYYVRVYDWYAPVTSTVVGVQVEPAIRLIPPSHSSFATVGSLQAVPVIVMVYGPGVPAASSTTGM